MGMGKILIIDDDQEFLDVLADQLAIIGYESIKAAGCEAGVNKITSPDVDLVLSDIVMGCGNGLELLAHARRIGVTKPFILMSGFDNRDFMLSAIRMGVVDFLSKPFSEVDLKESIERCLAADTSDLGTTTKKSAGSTP